MTEYHPDPVSSAAGDIARPANSPCPGCHANAEWRISISANTSPLQVVRTITATCQRCGHSLFRTHPEATALGALIGRVRNAFGRNNRMQNVNTAPAAA